jgi:hypothetical protein
MVAAHAHMTKGEPPGSVRPGISPDLDGPGGRG